MASSTCDADLVLFMAGNQFMVMDELLEEFRSLHPHIKRVFFETLPLASNSSRYWPEEHDSATECS